MKRNSKVIAPLTLGLSAVILLGACSSGSEASSSGADLTGTPVKLMAIHAQGTDIVNFPHFEAAARASARAINERGGIKGGAVEIIYCNDKNDPVAGEQCARKAVEEKVVAVVGYASPIATDKIHPILDAANIPIIGGYPLTDSDYRDPLMFNVDGGGVAQYSACGPALAESGAKNIAIVAFDVAAAVGNIEQLETGIVGAGLNVTRNDIKVPLTATDLAPIVQQIKDSGADGVGASVTEQLMLQLLKTTADQGLDIKFCSVEGTMTSKGLAGLGEIAGNALSSGSLPLTNTKNPSVAAYIKELQAEAEAGNEDAAADLVTERGYPAWVGPRIVERVAQDIDGELTASSLVKALQVSTDVDADMFGTIDFTKPGPVEPSIRNMFAYISQWDTNSKDKILLQPEPVDVAKLY